MSGGAFNFAFSNAYDIGPHGSANNLIGFGPLFWDRAPVQFSDFEPDQWRDELRITLERKLGLRPEEIQPIPDAPLIDAKPVAETAAPWLGIVDAMNNPAALQALHRKRDEDDVAILMMAA